MRTVSFKVNDKTAEIISRLDESRRAQLSRQIEELISGDTKFIMAVRKMQKEAKQNGLDEERLEKLLNEE
jgi:SPX domain protein involved in polyphosphate accumulation